MSNQATIEEAFEFVRNGASIKQFDGAAGVPITRIETIWNSTIDNQRFGYANIENSDEYKSHLLKDGDILMSHINSPKHLGKCAIYKCNPRTLIHGMNLLNLRPNKKLLSPQFAFYFFGSNAFKEAIAKISNQSVNQASFSTTSLKKLKIPLPPLAEQQKIAAILDAADSLRQKDQQLVERYTALSQSLFLEMFGDPVTNPMGWLSVNWEDVLTIKNGKNQCKVVNSEGLYPIYGSGGIMGFADDYLCEAGTTVIGRKGSINKPIYVKTRFWNVDTAFGLCAGDNLNSIFLYYFCIKFNFLKLNKATTLPSLTKTDLLKITMPLPPMNLQNQFYERIQLIEAQKQQAKLSLAKSEALFTSLLQRAFTGELTAKLVA